ncbi:MAG: hypothetical protein KAW02_04360 [candidate division Zixibacteria bacterium]|nr:hypothetical protein [candidate division Zixibacteria bacterium]
MSKDALAAPPKAGLCAQVHYDLANVLKEATELNVKSIRNRIEEKALLLANIFIN